jgi:phosphonopyruvate decarboxylase
MKTDIFIKILSEIAGIKFFTGVPDSLLGPLCDYLEGPYPGQALAHLRAPNEGSAVALASGHYLATKEVPCVYLQNSGLGNAVNPILSLTHPDLYQIPILFLIGWRGEPGLKDEPQHAAQGRLTIKLLESLELAVFSFGPQTSSDDLKDLLRKSLKLFDQGGSVALVVKKGSFEAASKTAYANPYLLPRAEVIESLIKAARPEDLFLSSTGKISRELFELRQALGQENRDFLTIGSMGHCSALALGVALATKKRVWCLDGDGAFLMHMGAAALIGELKAKNFIHVVLDNSAHDSVGGMPSAAPGAEIGSIALACGYRQSFSVTDRQALAQALELSLGSDGPTMIAVKVALGSRPNLGRPSQTPLQIKENFMKFIKN